MPKKQTNYEELFEKFVVEYDIVQLRDFRKKDKNVQTVLKSDNFSGRRGKAGGGGEKLFNKMESTGAYQTLEQLYDNLNETITTQDDVLQGVGSTIFNNKSFAIKDQLNLKKRIFAGKQAKKKQFAARAEGLKDVVVDERGRIRIGGSSFSSKASAKTIKRRFFSDATDEYDEQVREAARKAGLEVNI